MRPFRGMPSKCTCLVKRTHEPCAPTCCAAINLHTCLRGNCQLDCGRTHEPCVPTLAQTVLRVGHVDNQRLVPCVSIPAILRANFSHISVQYRSYYAVKWVRLKCRDSRFVRPSRGEYPANAHVWLSGRTSRASLHAVQQSTCTPVYTLTINRFVRLSGRMTKHGRSF